MAESNPVPFEVLGDPETTPFRTGLELTVYTFDDPMQPIDVLPGREKIEYIDELKAPGGGTFAINRHDPKLVETPSLIDYRNVCKVSLDGNIIGAFVIKKRKLELVSQGEKVSERWTVGGPGLRTWFDDAVVLPYLGLRQDSTGKRHFSWASERGDWYVPADWDNVVSIQQYDAEANTNPFGTAPVDWLETAPDIFANSHWIWESAAEPSTVGECYFRYEFTTTGSPANFTLFCSAKDNFTIYVDGEPVINTIENGAWTKTWKADFSLNAGDHVIAARVRARNLGRDIAGLILGLYNNTTSTVVAQSHPFTSNPDDIWKVNSYPAVAPGWTPGAIVLTLLAEAQTRGVEFPNWINPTFTSAVDSDGVPWPRALDWSFGIGTSYLEVIEKLEELVCDAWIDPATLEFHLYSERGVERTTQSPAVQPVKFEVARNVTEVGEEVTNNVKNTLAVETEDGWLSLSDALTGSVAKYGRLEGYVSTGASEAVSADIAQRTFEMLANPPVSSTYSILDVDDARPWIDFFVGDSVLAPGAGSESADESELGIRRVVSLSVTEENNGQPGFTIEFDHISEVQEQRFERWIKTGAGDGALKGAIKNVSVGGGSGSGVPSSQSTQSGPSGLQGEPGPVGLEWRGAWSAVTEYVYRDVVFYEDSAWFAVDTSTNEPPSLVAPSWNLMAASGDTGATGAPGADGLSVNWQGTWSALTAYVVNDAVSYDGASYIATASSTGEIPSPASAFWDVLAEKGATGALVPRDLATVTTGSLANNAQVQTTIEMSYGYRIYKITTSVPARVRLYGTAAKQAADLSRPIGTDPTGDHGLLFEFVTTPSVLSAYLSPLVDGANFESPVSIDIPITVTNISGGTSAVTVDLDYAVTE